MTTYAKRLRRGRKVPEIILTPDHRYLVDGKEMPGTTTVIKKAGIMGYLPEDEYYLVRGQYVHEALELHLNGDLDIDSLSEGIKGFVESGIAFIETTGYKATHTELMLHDPIYSYCGKPDCVPLLDWKSGGPSHWHVVQMAAYDNLLRVNKIPSKGMPLNVHLRKDGKLPKVEPYEISELRDALKVFYAGLLLYNWRKERNLL